MGQALFMGGSAAFFTAYILIAEALGLLGTSNISAITAPDGPDRGGFFGLVDGLVLALTYSFDLAGRFFTLLLFQAPGQSAESLVTILIFIPLTFVNGFIIIKLIRG